MDKVLEVTGFNENGAEYLEWTPAQPVLIPGIALEVDTSQNYMKYQVGHGTRLTVSLAELSLSRALIERSPDFLVPTREIVEVQDALAIRKIDTLTSRIVNVRNRFPDVHRPNATAVASGLQYFKDLRILSIYTDGSWSRQDTISSLLLGNGKVNTAGAIAVHTNRGMILVRITMDVLSGSAYDAEVISLLIAHEIAGDRSIDIWSDCEAAMKRLRSRNLGALSQCLSGWRRNTNVQFKKVRAHPEDRLPYDLWSPEEGGNYLADRVAGGFIVPSFTVSAADWLKNLASRSKISLASRDGVPIVRDIKFLKSTLDIEDYLRERDDFRAADGKPRIWVGANIALHHKLLGRSKRIGDRTITQRIGLVKRWQWHSARSDNKCQACGEIIKGIEHPLRQCCAQEMIDARDAWWREVEHVLSKSPLHLQQDLHIIIKHCRESPGGETACCGSFLPHFVANLPNNNKIIDDLQRKVILKILKTVSAGCRRLLRLAAEIQRGPLGINLHQYTILNFFKPIHTTTIKTPKSNAPIIKLKNKNMTYLNMNLNPHDIFHTTPSLTTNDVLYWEFKAG